MLVCCFSVATNLIWAQGPGSSEATGGTAGSSAMALETGDVTSSVAETLYIGPGDYTINGTWEIYSKNVWISPDATFTGTGLMKFFNPSVAGGAASPTLIDGNNSSNFINVNIELDNASNLVLTDIAGPGAPWTDAAGLANLSTGANFNFNVANGDVLLGNFDMITATAATLSGYAPDRFVVTAGTGHLVHNNYTGNFVYPVGIAEANYTPAAVNNIAANTTHVLVQDYATSAADENAAPQTFGVDRTWNIYADNAAGNSIVNLQHNGVGGSPASTNQALFDESNHFVTQWGAAAHNASGDFTSSTTWQTNTMGSGTAGNLSSTGTVAGSNMRSHSYTAFGLNASDPLSFFTKSSNATILPVNLVSFIGKGVKCNVLLNWQTSSEINFSYFEVQYSADGNKFSKLGKVMSKGDPNGSSYSFTASQPTGKGFYRLAITDLDGTVKYSPLSEVNTVCEVRNITVSPNPTSDIVSVSGLKTGEMIQVYGLNGQLLVKKIAEGIREEINLSNYASGVYTVVVSNATEKIATTQVEKK